MTSVVLLSSKSSSGGGGSGEAAVGIGVVVESAVIRPGSHNGVGIAAAATAAEGAPSRTTGAESFAAYLDPESRLNRVVDGMAQLEVANTTASGTHEGTSGGRVFKVSKNRNIHNDRETSGAKQSIVPRHAVGELTVCV